MKLKELYTRIVETTGLDVMTIGSLQTAVANCMADLTARGYKTFKELRLTDVIQDESTHETIESEAGYFSMPIPVSQIRKVLYVKIFVGHKGVNAFRYSLSNPNVERNWVGGRFRSYLGPHEAVFYIKDDRLVIEYSTALPPLEEIKFGYYERLSAPTIDVSKTDEDNLENIEINIREEFEDALVFYAAYFYYSRFIKDVEKIQFYLNNYKYYVEDITHELAYEDEFFEEDSIIHTEE